MLQKIKELSAKDLEMLISFINVPVGDNLMDTLTKLIDLKIYKYEDLLNLALENKKLNVLIDVNEVYDDLMFEAYNVYYHLKETLTDAHKEYPNIDGLTMMFEFIPFYENLLSISKFEKPKTRTIQKMFFENLLAENIEIENYEECSIIKKTINQI